MSGNVAKLKPKQKEAILALLLVLSQLPQDSTNGATRSLNTICEMLVQGTCLILLVERPDRADREERIYLPPAGLRFTTAGQSRVWG